MTLGDLIERLEDADQTAVVRHGFTFPHSWRGIYSELAFEPASNVKVSEMLADARSALGATYEGYKGGEFLMHEYSEVYLAEYGTLGEGIGPLLLSYMLADVIK